MAELEAWHRFQRSTPQLDHPFLAPAFAMAAGRVRPRTRVAVLEDGSDLVGFLAFERNFRVGRPVAAGVSDRQGLVHVPGLEWDVRELLEACSIDVWEFDHLVDGQAVASGSKITPFNCPIIDVSDGYQAYLAERRRTSKKTVTSTLSKQRKLERDLGSTRFDFDVHDSELLGLLLRWKSAQYRRTGRRDRFGVDWIERLVNDLHATRSEACTGTLSVLYVAERAVAIHFGLRSSSGLACWFPAYDVNLAKYSPGLVLHLAMAEAAAAAGLRYLDLGRGDEEYKQSLKTGDVIVGEGCSERPSAAALVRRLQRSPRRIGQYAISRSPALRRGGRRILRTLGSLRSSG